MDAFFASIEIRDCPSLRGQPVIVGGLSSRGVVCAASYEARKFGVKSAMPTFQARRLCPDAVFVSPQMDKYAAVSQQIHGVFSEFTSEIEPIAFDEAYLDISGSLSIFRTPLALAQKLKQRVLEVTQLVVSVGVGPNKLIAKIACTLGKPNGLKCVAPDQAAALLAPLPIRRLWGVGQVTERTLLDRGIKTIGDLRAADPALLEDVFGSRWHEARQMALGLDNRRVEANRENRSIGEENTFENDVIDPLAISAAITTHSEAVAHRLRQLHTRARTVTLKIRLGTARGYVPNRTAPGVDAPRYPLVTRSRTLTRAVQDGESIRAAALELWAEARIVEPLRLIGVSTSQFEAESAAQMELFPSKSRSDRLGAALDAIQERFGRDAIHRAVVAPTKLTPSQAAKPGENRLRKGR